MLTHGMAQLASALSLSAADRCPTCHHVQTSGVWFLIGFLGQAVFTARFLSQWLASERQGRSVIPVSFWWLSLVGGWMLLVYAVHREDPVIVIGQILGVLIYGRNLWLINAGRVPQPGQNTHEIRKPRHSPARAIGRFLRPDPRKHPAESDLALEPSLKRLRFDHDQPCSDPSSASSRPLSTRLRARQDAL